ncbi:MAG: response regulator, partial [Candidatus Desulfofervidaceae bacterium]|nr:response regulator [Candidatus Desulfofervidaceae bacterium]
GDLEQKATVKSRDEIGQLARVFNEMTKEIRQGRKKLSEARDYTANIINHMSESLIVIDTERKIKTVNKAAISLLGYEEEELLGQPISLIAEEGERIFSQVANQLIRTRSPILNYDLVYLTKEGKRIPVNASFSPLSDNSGNYIGVVCLAKDMREIKKLITKLDQIYNGVPTPIRVVDTKFNVLSQNKAMSELIGVSTEEAVGKKCYELFRCSYCQTKDCTLRLILEGRRKVDREETRITPEGKVIWCQRFGTPFKDSEGEIIGIIEIFIDITEKKQFVQELERKTEELHLAFATQQAYTDVLSCLTKTVELQTLLEEVLIKVVHYTYSQLGVVYLQEEERLKPTAGYALDIKEVPVFKIGEGLPGQCAKEKEQIVVSDVPTDYFKIASGSGQRVPQHIVCAPILFKGQLIGVLELAAFTAFSDEDFQFLKIVADQLGVGINHALIYQKAENLARELQDKNELLVSQNEELKAQSEELMALNEELKAQTEELAAQEKALEEKTRQVEKANRLKSEFLSNMSHELRTPLNAILGMAKLLKTGVGGEVNDKQRDYLEIIERSGQNLLELINDVLDLSKIEAGKVEIIWNKVVLKEFIDDLLKSVRMLAEEKGLTIKSVFKGEIDYIVTDQEKLRQILLNLLSNAIKFTEKGEIIVIVEETNADITISVKDTGIGIPEEALDYIFDAFRQVDGSTTRKYGGTGLGLSIVKKLVELLGGKVKVKSKLNKGSTFTVILPKEPISREKLDKSWKEKTRAVLLPEETSDISPQTRVKKQVLIIDDNPIVTRELSALLKDENYDLSFAFTGEKGLEFIKKLKPDVVILDLKMPEMDGFAVLEALQQDKEIKNTPVIVLSALDLTEAEKKRLTPNVKAILLKGQTDKANLIRIMRKILYPKVNLQTRTTASFLKLESEVIPVGSAKILIVEDNPDNLFLLKEALKDTNHIIYTAENGTQAIEQAQKVKPDLIIMDMLMPVMDGYEATQRLRKDPAFKNVPIIALTARAMRGDREKVLAAGCNDYLAKPVDPFVLKKKIEEWLIIKKKHEVKP